MTCHDLCSEFGYQYVIAIDQQRGNPGEPTKGSPFQGCGSYTTYEEIIYGVQTYLSYINIYVFVWVSDFVISIYCQTLPVGWELNIYYAINKGVSSGSLTVTKVWIEVLVYYSTGLVKTVAPPITQVSLLYLSLGLWNA